MKKIVLGLLIVLSQVPGYCKGLAPVATTTATGFNVKFASNGTPLVATQNGAVVAVTGTVNAALGYGKYLPIVASGAIDGAKMRGPWGAAIGALGSVAIIAVPMLLDSYIRAGLRVKPDGTIEGADPSVCTVAPCSEYNVLGGPWSSTIAGGCSAGFAAFNASNVGGWPVTYTHITAGQCDGYSTQPNGTTQRFAQPYGSQSVPPKPSAYVAVTQEEAVSKLTASAPTIGEVQALIDLNFPPEPAMVSLSGPSTMPLFNTVQLGTDGSSVTTTETATMSYFPDSVRVARERAQTTTKAPVVTNTVTTNPDGTTTTSVTTTPGTTVTTTQNLTPSATPESETKSDVTCGLPGTPICAVKVDETATPAAVLENVYSPKLEAPDTSSKSAIAGASLITAPAWSFSFQLPTGCAPYVTGLRGFIMNVCQFQSTIHDLLSMVWAAATAFGLIGMVGRTIRES